MLAPAVPWISPALAVASRPVALELRRRRLAPAMARVSPVLAASSRRVSPGLRRRPRLGSELWLKTCLGFVRFLVLVVVG